jgi:hypothetical protein
MTFIESLIERNVSLDLSKVDILIVYIPTAHYGKQIVYQRLFFGK